MLTLGPRTLETWMFYHTGLLLSYCSHRGPLGVKDHPVIKWPRGILIAPGAAQAIANGSPLTIYASSGWRVREPVEQDFNTLLQLEIMFEISP